MLAGRGNGRNQAINRSSLVRFPSPLRPSAVNIPEGLQFRADSGVQSTLALPHKLPLLSHNRCPQSWPFLPLLRFSLVAKLENCQVEQTYVGMPPALGPEMYGGGDNRTSLHGRFFPSEGMPELKSSGRANPLLCVISLMHAASQWSTSVNLSF